jgi:hypothetical protein
LNIAEHYRTSKRNKRETLFVSTFRRNTASKPQPKSFD